MPSSESIWRAFKILKRHTRATTSKRKEVCVKRIFKKSEGVVCGGWGMEKVIFSMRWCLRLEDYERCTALHKWPSLRQPFDTRFWDDFFFFFFAFELLSMLGCRSEFIFAFSVYVRGNNGWSFGIVWNFDGFDIGIGHRSRFCGHKKSVLVCVFCTNFENR